MNKRLTFFTSRLVLLALGVFTTNTLCAEELTDGPDMRPIVSIDKKNIENKTNQPRANFNTLIDRLDHELTQTSFYRVVDIAALEETIKKDEMYGVIADNANCGTDITKAALLVRMSVTTYGFSSEAVRNAYTLATEKSQIARVELILKIIDAYTGETKTSRNLSESACVARTVHGRGRDNDAEEALQDACRKVCRQIVKELVKYTPFYVLSIEDGSVMTDIPPTVCKIGDMYHVFKQGKGVKNRRTGKVVRSEKKIALVRIESVSEDCSMASVVEIYNNKESIDDKCILKPVALSPTLPPPSPTQPLRPVTPRTCPF